MAKPLTVRFIETLKPGETRAEIPDGAAPGLFLLVQASGVKSWAFRYRSPTDGKNCKLTIGRYPAFGLAEARQEAHASARLVARGIDPRDHRRELAAKAADTSHLIGVLLDQFFERHVTVKNRASTANEVRRLIEKEVRPVWCTRKIQTITRRDVAALLDQLVDRGAAVTANRLLALVRKFFNWCIDRGVLETSPARGVQPPSEEVGRDRILADNEVRWFWKATATLDVFSAAFRLMLLTGQRRGEVSQMRRTELHLEPEPIWAIPAEKTKNGRPHFVPLSGLALDVISYLPPPANSPWVFSTDGASPISGWSKAKAALDARMLAAAKKEAQNAGRDNSGAGFVPWRLHDLRRTAASGMARLGQPVHVVEAALNHRSGTISGVAAVFNRYDYLQEKRRALEAWASHVTHLTELGKESNVVPLQTAQHR